MTTGVAGFVLLLFSLMRWIPGGWTVADHLRYGLLWAALLLVPPVWWLRWRLPLLPLLLSILVNAIMIVPTLMPATVPDGAGQGGAIRLVHSNVWINNKDLSRLDMQVGEQAADIVVLIERFAHNGKGWRKPFLEKLPYMAGCDEADCGTNIFSRWPVQRLGIVTSQWHDGMEIPSYVAVRVLRPEGAFTLATAHFSQPFRTLDHARQAEWVARILRELPPPVILSGDFNAAPWSTAMQTIIRDGGVTRLSTTGPTWPTWLLPVGVPIDHVLGGPGVGARDVRVLGPIGSDHRPIALTILLPKAE